MIDILREAISVTVFAFAPLLLIEFFEVATKGGIRILISGRRAAQYITSSFVGALPGCMGIFLSVSFYMRGLLTLGGLCAAMIASTGDEAFVMLRLFPKKALMLFGVLFFLGIVFAPIADYIVKKFKIPSSWDEEAKHAHAAKCEAGYSFKNIKEFTLSRALFTSLSVALIALTYFNILEVESFGVKIFMLVILALVFFMSLVVSPHYLKDHIINHLVKKHLGRIFLWTVLALIFVKFGLTFFNLEHFIKSNMAFVLVFAALIGLIPQSGPHMIFVFLFADSLVPFSVLFTNSFIQDGHGCLPLLAYSVHDTIYVKLFKLTAGLIIGLILFKMGL